MNPKESKHSDSEYDRDMDMLLERWGRWARAGTSGLSSVGRGGTILDQAYRDIVAEMIDQLVAQLPRSQKYAVIYRWEKQRSETLIADGWHMPRHRFKRILIMATGWLCSSLASRIDAAPTLENVARWERRQK